MGNTGFIRQLAQAGLALMLGLAACGLGAQSVPPRMGGGPMQPAATGPVAGGHMMPTTPTAVPQVSPVAPSLPTSLLQQPAQPAQVTLSGERLSIQANNSSLSAILHDISNISGMKVEGLGSDERVFGTFGPGAPRDVIADLLNGTAYNLVLLGDLSNGAPRELILTPATHGGAVATPMQGPQTMAEESEPEAPEVVPPQPEPPPEQPNSPPPPGGVKTPQQLFEQLQRLRQGQGQQSQDPQQQTPPQQ